VSGPERRGILADHAADLWAIGLVALGVLLGLALYGNAAGAVGRAVGDGLGLVIGWVRYLLPPVLVAAGIWVLVGQGRPSLLRSVLGAVLGLLALCGLADLAGGSPRLGASHQVLRGAGGWLGVGSGRSLQAGMGTAGATVVLLAVFLVAIVLATGVSLRAMGRAAGRAVAAGTRAATAWWSSPAETAPSAGALAAPLARSVADPLPGWPDAATAGSAASAAGEEPPVGAGTSAEEDAAAERVPASAPTPEETAPSRPMAGGAGEPPMGPAPGEWRLPPAGLLKRSRQQRQDEHLVDVAGSALVAALAAHGVETRLVGRTIGPTVTRFELELGPGVKVARVTSLSRDIAYAMASPDVRILAPIPGRSALGVEVPNRQRQLVSLGDILSSPEAQVAEHPLEVALGRDISGTAVLVNLAEMPHVLISGATGAGKSSCINSLVTSVLMRSTPDEVRLILVDPKRVELGQYNGLPHLLAPVVVDPKKAANALAWAVKEMERRYDLLAQHGVRDITSYNDAYERGDLEAPDGPSVHAQLSAVAARAHAAARAAAQPYDAEAESSPPADGAEPPTDRGGDTSDGEGLEDDGPALAEDRPERLPLVLVVVDELNDLMMVAARDVEESVVRIAQMARAVGIHLVLATQRPSVDVITGLIKANVPSRMAFSVSSLADSRVILDQPGAERLIGKGDMLLLTASSNIPRRLQAPWVSEAEVQAVVAHWRRQGGAREPVVAIEGADERVAAAADGDDDELLAAAMDLVVRSQLGSTSMLQRKLRVGFARAGRLMDLLERRGVVGPSEGSKARAVLMTPDELDDRPL
jgi:S-DNA-T family DNA segregation ATPase FtsK/SpoIIIE